MRSQRLLAMIAATLVVGGLIYAQADDVKRDAGIPATAKTSTPPAGSGAAKKEAKTKPAIAITPEREAAVLTFVQRNHAELAELLAVLKASQPEEYERAIREIFRATERMNQVIERDPLQYELEVAAWTAQSRVQLLAAKLKMGSSDDLVKKLRDALKTQNEAKISLLKHERQKTSDRLGKLDGDITRFESDRDEVVNKQLKLLTRTAGEARPAKLLPKTTTKPKSPAAEKK